MKRKIFGIVTTATIILSTLATGTVEANNNIAVDRMAGSNRYYTSVEISKRTFTNSEYVVVASGDNYPDALVGGTLSTQIGAPMLLTSKNSLNDGVKGEILKFKNKGSLKEVFILGGSGSLSNNVENSIKSLDVKVTRLSGNSRQETALAIAEKRAELAGVSKENIKYAGIDGNNFADALSAGPFIGTMKDDFYALIPNSKKTAQDFSYDIVFGGIGSVPKGTEKTRLAGNNRMDTAIKIADGYKTFHKNTVDTIVLVNGNNYPDALAASSIAGVNNAPVILTNQNNAPQEVLQYILDNNIEKMIVIGGNNSVSGEVIGDVKQVVNEGIIHNNTGNNSNNNQTIGEFGGTYYSFPNNPYFHKDNCVVVYGAKDKNPNIVKYNSVDDALAAGKKPCEKCKPTEGVDTNNNTTEKPSTDNTINETSGIYYSFPNNPLYHKENCVVVTGAKDSNPNIQKFSGKDAAIKAGKRSCPKCNS